MSLTVDQAIELALQHHRQGDLATAESIYRQVLDKFPQHGVAMHYLGMLAHQLQRHADAERLVVASLRLLPRSAGYLGNLGEIYRAMHRFDDAEAAFREALALNASAPQIHNNLGLTRLDQGRVEEALELLATAVRLFPDEPISRVNFGVALNRIGRCEEAIQQLQTAATLAPRMPEAYLNLANALTALNRLPEALQAANAGLAAAPNDADLHLARGHILLKDGKLAEGFTEAEWRLRGNRKLARDMPQPLWRGEPLAGKTILLYSEQGYGDDLQFARYVPLLAERGANVMIESMPALRRLFGSLQGAAAVINPDDPKPPFDFRCSIPSLPAIFGTDLQSIPTGVPYLQADPQLIEQWAARFGERNGTMRVGLCWAGNPKHEKDRVRSMRLADLAPLAGLERVRFYSLQKGPAAAEAESPPPGMPLIDLSDQLHDFADTAAAMMNLDLVISVDTAAAHLAGALGRPCWTLLSAAGEWRWMLNRADSPWYPTMKLFRQRTMNGWKELMVGVAEKLRTESGGVV